MKAVIGPVGEWRLPLMTTENVVAGFHDDKGQRVLAQGEYFLSEAGGRRAGGSGRWRVVIQVRERIVSRMAWHNGQPWYPYQDDGRPGERHQDEVIWPTWPATLKEETDASATPLADLQAHWDEATGRLRDSAKWMAAVIGAALAAVIPTAPLAGVSRHITLVPAALGGAGLFLIGATMMLILRVMQPQSVSYDDIQCASDPGGFLDKARRLISRRPRGGRIRDASLYKWKQDVEKHPDLYLPCCVETLSELRELMVLEEATLMALALAEEDAREGGVSGRLAAARAARAARLHELRAAAASVVTLGVYYQVRARSNIATYWGVTLGVLGIIGIIAAVTWPIR